MVKVLHLFPTLNDGLVELLKSLTEEEWRKPTVCKQWTVKDIAAHLLDTCLRRLSIGRDGFSLPFSPVPSYTELVKQLNAMNGIWVDAYKRVSAPILIEQIDTSQHQYFSYLSTLDPEGPALFPVAWAGEEVSKNWFDVAREYTERFLHQQQIRQAVGAPGLLTRELYFPFLETMMLALPHTYNTLRADAASGSKVKVDIVGNAGGSWIMEKREEGWFFTTNAFEPDAQVYIDEQIAWLLFSKGVDVMEARQFWQVIGDQYLGSAALKMTSVMA